MKLQIPAEDFWFIEQLAIEIQKLVVRPRMAKALRSGLLRVLFAIKSLPEIANGTNIDISICDMGENKDNPTGHYSLKIDGNSFDFIHFTEDGHTDFQISYFSGECLCIEEFLNLAGDAKRVALQEHLDAFALQSIKGHVLLSEY